MDGETKKGVSVSLTHNIGAGTSFKTYRVVFSMLDAVTIRQCRLLARSQTIEITSKIAYT